MDESNRRRLMRAVEGIKTLDEPLPDTEQPDQPKQEPIRNCSTCKLYPCKLWVEGPQATLMDGAVFNIRAVAQVPMLCGGYYWEERPLSEWDKRKRIEPAGLAQFKKKGDG